MYKLEPDDIQAMLAEAARVLTKPKDKEVMRRLVSSTRATAPKEWDKRRIAAMLGKAGKMHEAEMVVHDIEVGWERADACLQMARALQEIEDTYHCRCMANVAVMEARKAQETESMQDRLDAAAVLAETACFLHDIGEVESAKKAAEAIVDDVRREKFEEYVREKEYQPPVEENSEQTLSPSESEQAN